MEPRIFDEGVQKFDSENTEFSLHTKVLEVKYIHDEIYFKKVNFTIT